MLENLDKYDELFLPGGAAPGETWANLTKTWLQHFKSPDPIDSLRAELAYHHPTKRMLVAFTKAKEPVWISFIRDGYGSSSEIKTELWRSATGTSKQLEVCQHRVDNDTLAIEISETTNWLVVAHHIWQKYCGKPTGRKYRTSSVKTLSRARTCQDCLKSRRQSTLLSVEAFGAAFGDFLNPDLEDDEKALKRMSVVLRRMADMDKNEMIDFLKDIRADEKSLRSAAPFLMKIKNATMGNPFWRRLKGTDI